MSRPFSSESAFRAIGHPLRRQVLDLLRDGERTVGDMHEAFQRVSMATLSDHLRILREAGVLKQRRRGRFRMYHVDPRLLQEIARWLKPFDSVRSSVDGSDHARGARK
jgi:DNA-binding transcriptional ArsR family regulator